MFTTADIITSMVAAFLTGTIVLYLFVEPMLTKQAESIVQLQKEMDIVTSNLHNALRHSEAQFDEAVEVLIQNGLVTDASHNDASGSMTERTISEVVKDAGALARRAPWFMQ